MKIHTGDMVVIITGKEKGKTGRVLRVLSGSNRVVVAGANMRTKFVKRTQNQPGRRLHFEGSIDASNVMLRDPESGKRSRVGYRVEESKETKGTAVPVLRTVHGKAKDARKERFAKRSGKALLSGKKLRKLVEEQEKGTEGAKGTKGVKGIKEAKKKMEKPMEEKTSAPKRSAFWERLGFGRGKGEESEGAGRGGGEIRKHDQSTRKAPTGER